MNIDKVGIIEQVSIRDQVADILRQHIISGKLKPDERLSERQISLQLNVSTTPIKEALRMLQSEGLIYTLPRRGSFVSSGYKEQIYQTILLRSAVDGVAAYLAAKSHDEASLKTISEPLMCAEELIESGSNDFEKISLYNDQFHEAIREATKGTQIINLGRNLRALDNSIRKLVNAGNLSAVKSRHLEHLSILSAIRDGEAEKAEDLMVNHIRNHSLKISMVES